MPTDGSAAVRGGASGGVREFALSFDPTIKTLLAPALAGPRRCRVVVRPEQLAVQMGLGGWAFSARVARSSIVEVEPVDRRVAAWGAHGWRGRWLVNGSGRGLVQLRIDPVGRARCVGVPVVLRQLTLSLEDPEGFVAVLRGDDRG